jgi:pectate lyase
MKNLKYILLTLILFLSCQEQEIPINEDDDEDDITIIEPPISDQYDGAFPGAEGFGKYTTGGRGGKIYIVTNLNNSGIGSLRWALEAREPRIVVFEVSGNIELESQLNIRSGDLTVAGQTAPGDGITVQNYPLVIRNANNIIIRYIRSRMGDLKNIEGDAFTIRKDSNGTSPENIIIDHCSFSWGTDETMSVVDVKNVTIQNSIISEGLHDSVHEKGRHGYGSLFGGENVSLYRNLITHFWIRMPSRSSSGSKNGIVDIRENVFYNWGFRATDNGSNTITNIYRNYYKPGPATFSAPNANTITKRFLNPTMADNDPTTYGKFYLEGNFMPTIDLSENQWLGVRLENGNNQNLYLENCKNKDSNGNLIPFEIPIWVYNNPLNAQDAYNEVLKTAGSSIMRDAIDIRIINEVTNGTTTYKGSKTGILGIIDSQKDVGGWPELKSMPAPKDTDRDGMPDEWEIKNGLNPNVPDDKNFNLNTKYTNIEVYINTLVKL